MGKSQYYVVEDFRAGMDLRKSAITAPAGSLRLLRNAHITPGGEIEKRAAFQYWTDAPAGTFGLVTVAGRTYTLQNGGTSVPAPNINTLGTIALPFPAGVTPARLSDWDIYDGLLYVVVLATNGNYYHFYNGAYVSGGKGSNVRTYKSKIFGVSGRTLYFSAVGNPADWSGTGSGFINVAQNDADSEELVSMEVYYDKLAVMSKLATQLWFLDPDPAKSTYSQTLRDAGTLAPNSLRQFVANDIYFLGSYGVRSLRARDVQQTAAVSDIGSPMDPYIQDLYASKGEDFMSKAFSLIAPRSGRYWLVLPDRILVLSNYPSPQIAAWSIYEPGFNIENVVVNDPYVVLRADDGRVFRYAGNSTSVAVYDNSPAEVILPYLGFEKPATAKFFHGIDVSAQGVWSVSAGMDPANEVAEDLIATINKPTFLGGRIGMAGRSTHISLRLRSTDNTAATLAKVFVHYETSDTD